MATFTKEDGGNVLSTVKEKILLQTEMPTLVSTVMESLMEEENIYGKMEAHMMVISIKE